MSISVCCPACWRWSELKRSTTCKGCGTPLILAYGRRVDEPPPPPPPPAAGPAAFQAAFDSPQPPAAMPTYALPSAPRGVDWVALTRWITMAYGSLSVIGVILFGLLVRHLTLTTVDPGTGRVLHDTVDIGAATVVLAVVVGVVYALFAWLTQFTVFRGVMLLIFSAGALAALSHIADSSTAVAFASLGGLIVDAGFCFVLLMSILSRPPAQY